jgi:hypothetical protein
MENVGQEDSKKWGAGPQANSKTLSGSAQGDKIDPEEGHHGYSQEKLDRMVTRVIKDRFTDVLNFCLPAEIETISVGKKDFRLIVCVPFDLPDPSPDGGKWWATRAAQNKLRRDFAKHLKSGRFNKTLANLFYTELAHFLLKRDNIGRYSKGIQRLLRKIPQQTLAGRPSNPIRKHLANEITNEGVKIYQALQNIQEAIRRWKNNDPKIEDPGIKKKLSRRYLVKTYPWMPLFYELIPKLPCKPYFDTGIETTQIVDKSGHPLPARLCEPDRWSTIDIAVKIIQAKLLQERGIKFPLRGIRQVLAKARPQVNN